MLSNDWNTWLDEWKIAWTHVLNIYLQCINDWTTLKLHTLKLWNQWVSELMSVWMYELINAWWIECMNLITHTWIALIHEWLNELMYKWMNTCMHDFIDWRMSWHMHVWTHKHIHSFMNSWMIDTHVMIYVDMPLYLICMYALWMWAYN